MFFTSPISWMYLSCTWLGVVMVVRGRVRGKGSGRGRVVVRARVRARFRLG